MMQRSNSKIPSAVSAARFYDRVAHEHFDRTVRRQKYHDAVELQIVSAVRASGGQPITSFLDIGTGDGVRASRLAAQLMPYRTTLVDVSPRMCELARTNFPGATVLTADASTLEFAKELNGQRFDVVTCLWGVLGLIEESSRRSLLLTLSRLLARGGSIFLDVPNSLNGRHYGLRAAVKGAARWRHGRDVHMLRELGDGEVGTGYHLFGPSEIENLGAAANLRISSKVYVNYASGARANMWSGQMLYRLRSVK